MRAKKKFEISKTFGKFIKTLNSKLEGQKEIEGASEENWETQDDNEKEVEDSSSPEEMLRNLDQKSDISFGMSLLRVDDYGIDHKKLDLMSAEDLDDWAFNFFNQLDELDSYEKAMISLVRLHQSFNIYTKSSTADLILETARRYALLYHYQIEYNLDKYNLYYEDADIKLVNSYPFQSSQILENEVKIASANLVKMGRQLYVESDWYFQGHIVTSFLLIAKDLLFSMQSKEVGDSEITFFELEEFHQTLRIILYKLKVHLRSRKDLSSDIGFIVEHESIKHTRSYKHYQKATELLDRELAK